MNGGGRVFTTVTQKLVAMKMVRKWGQARTRTVVERLLGIFCNYTAGSEETHRLPVINPHLK